MSIWILIFLAIFAMLVLGGLATIVFLGVFAVTKKRPSILPWIGGGVLVSLLLFMGVGFFLAAPQHSAWHAPGSPGFVSVSGPDESINVSMGPPRVSFHIAPLGWMLMFGLGVGVLMLVSHLWKSNQRGEHGGGWLATSFLIALLFLLFFVVRSWNSSSRVDVVHNWGEVPSHPGNVRVEVEKKLEEAAELAEAAGAAGQQSMQEVWEELNKPHIDLDEIHADMAEEGAAGETQDDEADDEDDGEDASDDGELSQAAAETVAEDEAAPEVTPAAASRPQPVRPRPKWINQPPKRVGNVWREVVFAGDYATLRECNLAADVEVLEVVRQHVVQLVQGGQQHPPVPHLDEMGVGIDYIRREIAKDEYVETVERSVGPMMRSYTLLEYSPSVDRDLQARWEAVERKLRVLTVGGVGALAFSLIGLAYGLLKVDTWTKGYYTKRLFLGVPAAIIAIIALAAAIGS